MGYPQPAETGNSTANGIINNTMEQERSKAIGMRFYWLRDRAEQGQFRIYWEAGATNFGDFYTKHHPAVYHKDMRPIHTYIGGLPIRVMGNLWKKGNSNPIGETASSKAGHSSTIACSHNTVKHSIYITSHLPNSLTVLSS